MRPVGFEPRAPIGQRPLDERGMVTFCAYAEREVGREALESSSAVLQTAARPSQLPAQVVVVEARKRPDVARDTGPCLKASGKTCVTSAEAVRAAPYATDTERTVRQIAQHTSYRDNCV